MGRVWVCCRGGFRGSWHAQRSPAPASFSAESGGKASSKDIHLQKVTEIPSPELEGFRFQGFFF